MRNGYQRPGGKGADDAERRSDVRSRFIFRGRNGSQVKLLWSTGDGLCLLTKRLERGRFARPSARDGKVFLTPAQLAMLLKVSTGGSLKDCLRPDYVVGLFILVDAE